MVDDFTDFTWTYFSNTKSKMVEFIKSPIKELKGLDIKVEYLWCDNAGEHIGKLQGLIMCWQWNTDGVYGA